MSMQTWTEIELFAAVAQQLAARSALIGGKPWGAAQGKPRIYMPSRRDCKVYFEFPDFPTGDETDLLGGACLKVLIDDCGQHPNWYKSQRAKLLAQHVEAAEKLAEFARPQADGLRGEPVTREAAERLVIGQTVTFYYGGAAGDDNDERSYPGVVTSVRFEPDQPGTIAPDDDGQTVQVAVDDGSGSRDASGAEGCRFYTWRGLLRYGGGAEVVRM